MKSNLHSTTCFNLTQNVSKNSEPQALSSCVVRFPIVEVASGPGSLTSSCAKNT